MEKAMRSKPQNSTGNSSKYWEKKSQCYCMWHTIETVKNNSYTLIRRLLSKAIEISQGIEWTLIMTIHSQKNRTVIK